jgi:hypothetical protein
MSSSGGEELAVDLPDGLEFFTGVGQRLFELKQPRLRSVQLPAELFGWRVAGRVDLIGDLPAQGLRETLRKRAQLSA